MADFDRSPFRGRRVLVTGGTGFLGRHLVERLVAEGAAVFRFNRPRSSQRRTDELTQAVTIVEGDLIYQADVMRAVSLSQPEIVFHLAAYGVDPRQSDPLMIIQTNIVGLIHLLKALAGVTTCKRFVYTGTCFEYGNQKVRLSEEAAIAPLNPYSASKTMGWHLCDLQYRQTGLPVVLIRPFTFFGPCERPDRLIPSVIQSILEGREIRISSGIQTRDYTYVEDVVEAYLRAAVSDQAVGQAFNIGSGMDFTVVEIVERIQNLMGSRSPVWVGAVQTRNDEVWRLCCDPSKAGKFLGWHPVVTFEEGLRRTIRWMEACQGVGLQAG